MNLTTKITFLIAFSFSIFSFSQQNSYQGLLWEISGNGLTTPSYLYGTMHVSNKLAFNVSDSFYICLNKAQGIALESSPARWMEDYRNMGAFAGRNYSSGGFYDEAFGINPPDKDVTYLLMQNKNGLMNQILYRFNSGSEDYQENTFLDMFIYQAGAKNNKPVFSLETLDEVIALEIKALTPSDEDEEEDNSRNAYLDGDSERKFALLEEAYRRGDLNTIDSLSKANNPTPNYHHYFIVERNRNMVNRIDSILHINSLFIGIGAAHLPGEGGAIEMLREKGYTVRAVNPKSTGKSHKMRKKLEELYRPISFSPFASADNFIRTVAPGTLFEMPTGQTGKIEYLCPEPANGGYYSITRFFTYGGIFGKDAANHQATFDSLVYIATPGELLKKEPIEVNGHKGYRILTLTSKNAYVNYHIFFTATEIIVFKGFGIGEYIQKSDPKQFFSQIQLAKLHGNWTDVRPKFGGASWKMKGLVSGQDMIEGLEDDKVSPLYQSYDSETGDYYMVSRTTYNDLDYIETDSFDLAYLGESFAKEHGFDLASTSFYAESGFSYVLQTLNADDEHPDNAKTLQIKILTQGGYYYMMATSAGETNANSFFSSFKFEKFNLTDDFGLYEDTTLFYTAETILEKEFPEFPSRRYGSDNEKKENRDYLGASKGNYHSIARTGEGIWVGYAKFNDYDAADSVQGFWDYRIERLTEENGLVLSRFEESIVDGDMVRNFVLTDTGSSKGIMTQMRLHHGVEYTMQSLIDTVVGPSIYVQHFFDTFAPMDTLIGRDLFEDKAVVFFDHINGEDSLNRVNALKSIKTIDFVEKDVTGLVDVYRNFEFEEETEQEYRENLILAMANIETKAAYDFLEDVYNENNFNSDLQFVVLKCFSYTETEEAYAAIKKLLLENPPFTEKDSKLQFFNNLYDSLELAKGYYPDMLEMVQYSDYHPFVLEFLVDGYLDTVFTFADFKAEKAAIFRNATIELKRTVANQADASKQKDTYSYNRVNQYNAYESLFLDYYTLMCGFKVNGDKETTAFFEDIYRIEDQKFKVEAEIIHYKLGLPVDTSVINGVSRDFKYRVWVYNRLDDNDMLSYFDSTITQEDIAFSLLYNSGYDPEKDSVVFLRTETVDTGKEIGTVYFFKRKEENKKNWMIDYVGLMPTDEEEFETYGKSTKKGLSVKNDEEMEETIDRTIEIFELSNRKRIEFDSNDYSWLDGLF